MIRNISPPPEPINIDRSFSNQLLSSHLGRVLGSPPSTPRNNHKQSIRYFNELCSYCPTLLLKLIHSSVDDEALKCSQIKPKGFTCACLLADVAGFVKLSKAYCSGGMLGIDKLQVVLQSYFVSIIDIVYSYGGDGKGLNTLF